MKGQIGQRPKLLALGASDRGSNPRLPICGDVCSNAEGTEARIGDSARLNTSSPSHRKMKMWRGSPRHNTPSCARQLVRSSLASNFTVLWRAYHPSCMPFCWTHSSVRTEHRASNGQSDRVFRLLTCMSSCQVDHGYSITLARSNPMDGGSNPSASVSAGERVDINTQCLQMTGLVSQLSLTLLTGAKYPCSQKPCSVAANHRSLWITQLRLLTFSPPTTSTIPSESATPSMPQLCEKKAPDRGSNPRRAT